MQQRQSIEKFKDKIDQMTPKSHIPPYSLGENFLVANRITSKSVPFFFLDNEVEILLIITT